MKVSSLCVAHMCAPISGLCSASGSVLMIPDGHACLKLEPQLTRQALVVLECFGLLRTLQERSATTVKVSKGSIALVLQMPFSITFSYIVLRSLIHTHTVTAWICVQTSWVSVGTRDTALVKAYMQVFLLNLNQLHRCHNPWHQSHVFFSMQITASKIHLSTFSLTKSLISWNLLFHFNSTENIFCFLFELSTKAVLLAAFLLLSTF